MNILLSGYFDKNFGDDIMQRTVVQALPEHTFFVNCREREMLSHLENFENVRINVRCDRIELFLNVIGTGFMYRGKRAKLEKLFSTLTSKKKKYPLSALIDCSLEDFDSPVAQHFANGDLKEYGLITCRDSKTYEYLKNNFRNTQIHFCPDLVFASGFEKSTHNEGFLGVAPVRRLYTGDNYEYYKELAAFCDRYTESYDRGVLLFAFDNGLENDVSAAESVKLMMKHKSRAEVVVYGGDCDSFVNEIKRCGAFVGSRFHSIVTAAMLSIPCAAVYDREKLRRLCDEMNIPGVSKDSFTADKITEFSEPFEKSPDASEHIEALKQYISRR